ncbi:MAG: DUF4296 domain-containing protein [Bacteroidales bacterium]|nr:DUF4296 domain-containing protein [Bacteroidales bacterium]
MKKIILLILSVFSIFGIACNSGNVPDDIIPKEKFIKILTEVHIADAVLTEKGLYDRKLKDSTESYYNYIFVKYNINRAKFDKSLQYYGKNTEEFEEMYNQVIANLKLKSTQFNITKSIFNLPDVALKNIEEQNKLLSSKKENQLWTLKRNWSLPDDGKLNIIKFERKLAPVQAEYVLSADYYVYKNDSTNGLTMLIYIYYKDGSHNTFQNKSFAKDEKWHKYTLKAVTNSKKTPSRIICKMADHRPGTKSKHMDIKNISLLRRIIKPKQTIPVKTKKTEQIKILKKNE